MRPWCADGAGGSDSARFRVFPDCAGISGQLASRVVKELLQAGVSVLAGTVGLAQLQISTAAAPHQTRLVTETSCEHLSLQRYYNNIITRYVTGVPEDDPAAEALDFALQFELIKKQEASKLQLQEVDFADPDSYGIPRWGTACIMRCMHNIMYSSHQQDTGKCCWHIHPVGMRHAHLSSPGWHIWSIRHLWSVAAIVPL